MVCSSGFRWGDCARWLVFLIRDFFGFGYRFMTHRRLGLEILDVTAGVISQVRHGFAQAAAYLGRSEKVLRNKVSRHIDTHHLSVEEFVDLHHWLRANTSLGWDAGLQTLCFEFNGVFMPLPDPSQELTRADDMAALLAAVREHGEAMVVCSEALANPRLTQAQYEDAEREAFEAMAALRVLVVRLRERRV